MNPELTHWTGPLGLPRFDLIRDEDFDPAFDACLKLAEEAVETIAANPAPPDFANTVAALETAEEPLNRLCAIFFTLTGVDSNPAREDLQRRIAPRLAAHGSKVSMDPRLFDRVEAVMQDAGGLAPEDCRLTELTLRGLRRAGAGLTGAARERMAAIRERLAVLSTDFAQNVLTDERDFAMGVADDQLSGLPDWLVRAMRAAARERGMPGQVVTLNRSLIVPFLEYCEDRALREAAWRAWCARGSGQGAGGAATDNRPIAAEILQLRHERARLLGYEDFASYKLEPEMARNAGNVEALLTQVWAAAKTRAEADAERLTAMLREDGVNGVLEPWDWRFYAERRRKAEHDLDEAEVKPYLTLEAMLGAVFDTAQRLFGIEMRAFTAPLWSPDARAWEVTRDGRRMAVFVGDYFARPGKRSGAWCSSLQQQHKIGAGQRPIVTNVCNFTPPEAAGAPAYLSWDDAHTLFHEFGHALHHILSDVSWPSISGTSVARDFVELPSQLFEHWLEQPEVLDRHARHAETGAPLPAALRDRILAAGNADQGFATTEYLESALVDLAFHRGAPPADPMARQAEVLAELGAPAAIPMRHATPHFAHVFSGDGYSSGYYSYMWSEVMDADAFAAFMEKGDPFDAETACRLEQWILSKGDSRPADELWLKFRGRTPGVEALLKGRGLLSEAG
ncbi:M3 family metallopeptidase [Paracoccus sp. P2]|uniref:M3 family metallopeptidase n=1 Tax=Paracoccus pantotrophus TaxID=82367 RepID=A0A1I5IRN9_PARPN|nr:M3 family metallopeptidase [Paracoccus pantotrophus]MDF3855086.1 M3 family metallopeptidase [Paracoccus pantotrophus]QFG37267.1 M3 family metallopeptidase [Paracoccus pantotrophus]QLH14826.1 M3 family metallopeptidase [Paracoccus pantotrophus]RDD95991.1 M3 family peptidase [Paracoccus pantotrophus]RKS52301.1 peptidyl-dipeptidase Dcp [Paracoccus pantotrophus]